MSQVEVDHRTDIWSLGVVMYEMATGQLPFREENELALVYSIVNEKPAPMTALRPDLPVELERIVDKAMQKDRRKRYQRMEELIVDLRVVARQSEVGETDAPKSAPVRERKKARVSRLQDLLQRHVPQLLGLYFLASLSVLLLVQTLVNYLPLSPHLPSFTLAVLASMIPTVFLYAYFHKKRESREWIRFRKIGIPLNLLVALALLFFLFKDKNLVGAATKTVTLKDEEGKTIERVIPKSEFRKKVALFVFENESSDSTLNWLRYGIVSALETDLAQDMYLDVSVEFAAELKEAGFPETIGAPLTLKKKIANDLHYHHFVAGSFTQQKDSLTIKATLYETKLSKPIAKISLTGADIFRLVDSMSVQLKHKLKIPAYRIEGTEDLPVAERLTQSIRAFKTAIAADYARLRQNDYKAAVQHLEQAVKEDSTFASAHHRLYEIYTMLNQGEQAEKALLKAVQYIYKFPERWQFQIKYDYYALKKEPEKQFALLKSWGELYPEDISAHEFLAREYQMRGQFDEAISAYKRCFELVSEEYALLLNIGSVYQQKGQYDEALAYYQRYAALFPQESRSYQMLGYLYKAIGNYPQAKAHYEKALLLEPEEVHTLINLADIETRLGNFAQALEQYQEALKACKTLECRIEIYGGLEYLYDLRGQISKSIELYHLSMAETEEELPPLLILFDKIDLFRKYLDIDQKEMALQTFQTFKGQVGPPMDQIVPYFTVFLYTELEDLENAEKAFQEIKPIIQSNTWNISGLNGGVFYLEARIHELKKDYVRAIESYQKCAEVQPEEDATINVQLGRCYRNLQKFKKAGEYLQKTLKLFPVEPKAHYELALVYWEQGKKEKAMEHLHTALKVWEEADPEYKPAKKAREKLAEWRR